jgi:hypothetical protein
VDLVAVDDEGEEPADRGKSIAMPDIAVQQHERVDSQENLSDLSAKTKGPGNAQGKIATAPLFQFSLDFKNPGPKPAHNPSNSTFHQQDNTLAGALEPTIFEDPPPNRKTMAASEYGERLDSHGRRDDQCHTERSSTKLFAAHVEDDDGTSPSPMFATHMQTRQHPPTRIEKPKQDRRNIVRPGTRKGRDAPSVSKAIAILDWAWKQEVSGLESAQHREVQLLNEQLSLIQESCNSLSQELDVERTANMTLRDELDGAKLSLEDLSKKHAAAKKFNDGLQNDLVARSQKNSSLEAELDATKGQLQTTKLELEKSRKSCDSNEAELGLSKKQFDDLQRDTENRVKELEWKISELERDLSKKADLLEKSQEEIARWQEKAENSEKIRQLIEAQMQMHRDLVSREVVALNSKVDEIQKVRNELRTEEIIRMLQDINSRKLTSPQDMMEIENKIQGLAGRYVQFWRPAALTHDVLIEVV